ncbi:MAG: hypothetical protein J5985_08270 [Kiritimatiellae bacterium]|nr:hypothetical protein [Kiritimatiellia bacterium]
MRNKHGQAALEFVIALFLFLIIVQGMIFLNDLSWTSLYLQATQRGEAGKNAMSDVALGRTPDGIRDWTDGADGIAFTPDDTPQKSGDGAFITQSLAERSAASPEDWVQVTDEIRVPVSLAQVHAAPSLSTLVPSIRQKEEVEVEVPEFLRRNVYGKDNVILRETVWMPFLDGLY